jgi:hypothetical protein
LGNAEFWVSDGDESSGCPLSTGQTNARTFGCPTDSGSGVTVVTVVRGSGVTVVTVVVTVSSVTGCGSGVTVVTVVVTVSSVTGCGSGDKVSAVLATATATGSGSGGTVRATATASALQLACSRIFFRRSKGDDGKRKNFHCTKLG